MKHANSDNSHLLRMDFAFEVQGLIVTMASRGNPKILTLSKSLSWQAMQGLYELVELRTTQQAISFIHSLERNALVNSLNSTRVDRLPPTSSLINKLYLSFDIAGQSPGGFYRSIFYPRLCIQLPRMSSLQELIFDISDGSTGGFKHMTNTDFVYPPSLTTVRMISVDVDGNKVSFKHALNLKLLT